MAEGNTIKLHKSEFDGIAGVLDKLCASFGNYQATIKELKKTAGGVESTTCDLEEVIQDLADSDESKEEKVKKAKELNKKIQNFVNSAVKHESDAAAEIKRKKEDFYKKYEYLRPNCEKSWRRKLHEFGQAVGRWVADHLEYIIAAVIIILAIVAVICIPGACAVLAIIVSLASTLMSVADLVATCITGKSIDQLLTDAGHPILGKIWKGVGWGLDVASVILPIGAMSAAGKTAMKQALKHPFKSGFQALKNGKDAFKAGAKGLFNTFKNNGFKAGMKQIGKGALDFGKNLIGYDDFKNAKDLFVAIKNGQRGDELANTAAKIIGLGGVPELKGSDKGQQYDSLLRNNSSDLNAGVRANNIADGSAHTSIMDFKVDTDSSSGMGNVLDNFRSGTGGSQYNVEGQMMDNFYQTVKGDDALKADLLNNTGVNIDDCVSGDSLQRKLGNNGYTLNANIGASNSDATVSVVPKWASNATGAHTHNMGIVDANASGFRHRSDFIQETVGSYNQYIRRLNNNYVSEHSFDIGSKLLKIARDELHITDAPYRMAENAFDFSYEEHPVLKRIAGVAQLQW